MSSSRRNSKQISTEEEPAAAQVVKSPEATKLKLKLKQPEQLNLTPNEVKELFVAIEKNNGKIVKHFLTAKNVNPDTLFESDIFEDGPFTWSALHAAAYYGSSKVVEILMEHNANVELQDTWYKGRPLAWAAFGGHLETAQLLIEKYGADKKATNDHGQVALELVYELTPKWSKMFAETNSSKASKSSKPKSDKESRSHHKDPNKPAKDAKDSKTATTNSSTNPYSAAFTELYQMVLHHKDKNGREVADIFLALPSKADYPDYYNVIKSPMSLALVLSRIKTGHYKSIEDFDREFQLIFENALIYNEDGSRINKDAKMLLKLFNTKKKEVFTAHKLIFNPVVHQDKNRTVVSSHTEGHMSFQAGEFVQLNNEARTILFIERLERDPKGNRFVIGSKFFRPDEIFQVPGQTFYENEVLKATGEHDYDFRLVDHKVYVQALKDFVKGAVIGFEPKDVFVLESRYSEAHKSAYVIKDWKRVYSVEPFAVAVRPYPSPVKPQRIPIPSKVNGDAALVNSHGRRASSATQSDSSKRNKQPKKSKSRRKRGGGGEDEDDSDDDSDDDDDDDSDIDVDGMTSPTQQQGRRISQQPQRHSQSQQVLPPQQQYPQQPQMHPQQQQQQQQHQFPPNGMPQQQQFPFGHPQHQQHPHQQHPHQDHSRRISSQFSPQGMMNPNMMHPQQQQQQMFAQQQQQHMYQQQQQQQAMQFQPMQPQFSPHHQQPLPPPQQQPMMQPQSPSSSQSQSMGSPGSPGMMGVDPRTGMVAPSFPPQPFIPADVATVYDPTVGPKEGYAMLQSVKVDAEDKSFAMNLSTLTFAHSFVVQHQVATVSLIPLLAQQLAPIQQQVGLSVFHNGRKIMPSGLVSLPAAPTVGHHVYTVNLTPGQNTVDVWVSAPVGGVFQGGPPGGKSETQQFFVFIQRNHS
ncbi:hypothetical protein BGZ83_003680 [Gryganskiella cystojenkinii]|nr:hypothetical protein BGZ83_003680 [Gryganskiella cystojenkinii]